MPRRGDAGFISEIRRVGEVLTVDGGGGMRRALFTVEKLNSRSQSLGPRPDDFACLRVHH